MGRGHMLGRGKEIMEAVHDNLRNLGLEALDVVNLRLGGFSGPEDEPFEEPLTALVELKEQGLVKHIGLSTVSAKQLKTAQAITEIVCIQNFYNVAQRGDDAFIDVACGAGDCVCALLSAGRIFAAAVVRAE